MTLDDLRDEARRKGYALVKSSVLDDLARARYDREKTFSPMAKMGQATMVSWKSLDEKERQSWRDRAAEG